MQHFLWLDRLVFLSEEITPIENQLIMQFLSSEVQVDCTTYDSYVEHPNMPSLQNVKR